MRFVLVCEGSSDAPLINHIERLLVECGCAHPQGDAFHQGSRHQGSRIGDKVREVVERSSDLDLLFVHRDADNAGTEARLREIEAGVREGIGDTPSRGLRHVAVVPVKMTEAWLLLDETAIRKVVRKPKGVQSLGLPPAAGVEAIADPKKVLRNALLAAVQTTGRRRRKFTREFPRLRRILLEDLPPGGQLASLPSWNAFRSATQDALAELAQAAGELPA